MKSDPICRHLLPLACFVALLGLVPRAHAAGNSATPTSTTWTSWEHELTSAKPHANPYADVTVRVTYRGPGGATFESFGFWDGGAIFRIRWMFPAAGRWTWHTACSDPDDVGLHNRSGTVDVAPYAGDSVLSRRGLLRVSADKRYLTFADGTPFLWVGDTAWNATRKATHPDWETYVRDRAGKKFTVVHLSMRTVGRDLASVVDAQGNPAFLGEGTARWNPAFWQQVDRKIRYANEHGLYILAVGIATSLDPRPRFVPPEPAARHFGRNLAARLAGSFVVVSPGFDEDPFGGATEERITQVGDEIRGVLPQHLLTNHPNPDEPDNDRLYSERYYDKAFVDFAGLQSGRGKPDLMTAERAARFAITRCLALHAREPHKPMINLEARYDSPYTQKELPRLPRSCGYWSMLSGSAGHSFGNDAIWTWGPWPASTPPHYAVPWTWEEGMNQPSSVEMMHFASFFGDIGWWRLAPAHQLIRNQTDDWVRRMVLAASDERDLAVAYLPDNDLIALDLSSFRAPMRGRWFDPRTGAWSELAAPVPNTAAVRLTRPASGDWALVLSAPAANRPQSPD